MGRFNAQDQLDVIASFSQVGLEMFRQPLPEYVQSVNNFVYDMGLEPTDKPDPESVGRIGFDQETNAYYREYHGGRTEEIDKGTYQNELMYNYLPQRFRTYKPTS